MGWRFPAKISRPRVAHFCGGKPLLFNGNTYSRPFTIARLEHHRRRHGDLGAWLAVLNEDSRVLANKVRRRLGICSDTNMLIATERSKVP